MELFKYITCYLRQVKNDKSADGRHFRRIFKCLLINVILDSIFIVLVVSLINFLFYRCSTNFYDMTRLFGFVIVIAFIFCLGLFTWAFLDDKHQEERELEYRKRRHKRGFNRQTDKMERITKNEHDKNL